MSKQKVIGFIVSCLCSCFMLVGCGADEVNPDSTATVQQASEVVGVPPTSEVFECTGMLGGPLHKCTCQTKEECDILAKHCKKHKGDYSCDPDGKKCTCAYPF